VLCAYIHILISPLSTLAALVITYNFPFTSQPTHTRRRRPHAHAPLTLFSAPKCRLNYQIMNCCSCFNFNNMIILLHFTFIKVSLPCATHPAHCHSLTRFIDINNCLRPKPPTPPPPCHLIYSTIPPSIAAAAPPSPLPPSQSVPRKAQLIL
jgi:hypothetical protein